MELAAATLSSFKLIDFVVKHAAWGQLERGKLASHAAHEIYVHFL